MSDQHPNIGTNDLITFDERRAAIATRRDVVKISGGRLRSRFRGSGHRLAL